MPEEAAPTTSGEKPFATPSPRWESVKQNFINGMAQRRKLESAGAQTSQPSSEHVLQNGDEMNFQVASPDLLPYYAVKDTQLISQSHEVQPPSELDVCRLIGEYLNMSRENAITHERHNLTLAA